MWMETKADGLGKIEKFHEQMKWEADRVNKLAGQIQLIRLIQSYPYGPKIKCFWNSFQKNKTQVLIGYYPGQCSNHNDFAHSLVATFDTSVNVLGADAVVMATPNDRYFWVSSVGLASPDNNTYPSIWTEIDIKFISVKNAGSSQHVSYSQVLPQGSQCKKVKAHHSHVNGSMFTLRLKAGFINPVGHCYIQSKRDGC